MMRLFDFARVTRLDRKHPRSSKRLKFAALEDRLMLSATQLDLSALELDDTGIAEVAQMLQKSDLGVQHDSGLAESLMVLKESNHHHDHSDPYFDHPGLASPELDDSVWPAAANGPPVLDLSQTFLLHSNAGASHTIYLDFDGHVTTNTIWNLLDNGGADIVTPAYDFDGDGSSFSDAEKERIQYIWRRVAEDFIPFDVNVTTEDPGFDALANVGGGDTNWGVRVVIGGSSSDWYGSGTGVAQIDSFDWSTDTPVFVFENQLNGSEKKVAEVASHEVGHTLGLGHDGGPGTSYYSGQGSGGTGWAPIMGSSYNKNLTQWDSGEFSGATNGEDDLAIITGGNGFGYRVDDHGNSNGQATLLTSTGTVDNQGIIEQNTDVDVFEFTTSGGLLDLQIDPVERGPNLDLLVELYNSTSTLIVSSNPVSLLDATINTTLSAGQYFLHITGTGAGDPLVSGYSDYGSLGQYYILGTVAQGSSDSVSIAPNAAVQAEGDSGSTAFTFTVTRSGDLSDATSVDYAVTGANPNDFVGGVRPSGTVNFAASETTKTITIDVAGDQTIESDENFTLTLSNTGGDTQITTSQASGTIVNDDVLNTSDNVAIAATNANKNEGDSGSTPFTFTITRTGYTADATSVDYAVTGASPNDFVGGVRPSGTVNFAAGETSKTITINVAGDQNVESNEGFTVTLSNAAGDTQITTSQASVTILNDDAATNGIVVAGLSGGDWLQSESTGTSLVTSEWTSWPATTGWTHVQTADVNGDGVDEVIGRRGNGDWWVTRKSGGDTISELWGSWSKIAWHDVQVADFDGDGRADIVGRTNGGHWWVARSNGTSFVNENWGFWSNRIAWYDVNVGDFDGDGRDDIAGRAQNGTWWVARSDGTSFVNENWAAWSSSVQWKNVLIGDFDGNGRDDIAGRAGSNWWTSMSTGTSFSNQLWGSWSAAATWSDVKTGDFDGDGRDDIVGRTSGKWWVARSTGSSFENQLWAEWSATANWVNVMIADMDLDGRDDIVARVNTNWFVAQSDGLSFDTSNWGQWATAQGWDQVVVGKLG